MNKVTNLWNLFALTGDPKHYLKFKQQDEDSDRSEHRGERLREENRIF